MCMGYSICWIFWMFEGVHEIYFPGLPDFGLNILSASPPLYIYIIYIKPLGVTSIIIFLQKSEKKTRGDENKNTSQKGHADATLPGGRDSFTWIILTFFVWVLDFQGIQSMEEIPQHLGCIKPYVNNGIKYLLTDAGFQPSTV